MKYGETLRQRSIPAWAHRECFLHLKSTSMALLGLVAWSCTLPSANSVSTDNIDYDDIKHFIKENTTAGKGKTVSIPGRGEDKLVEFENALFHILQDQHQRIDLFVKSKAGEIQRRLGEFNALFHFIFDLL